MRLYVTADYDVTAVGEAGITSNQISVSQLNG